ncbi:MAG: hypothetical protein ACKE5M_00965 [Methylophilaceae bacterium]
MKKTITIISLAIFASSCASVANKPISSLELSALSGKTITFTQRNKADFTAGTAGKAAFGALGGLSAISAGNKIVTANDIADPSQKMGEELATKFQETHALKLLESVVTVTDENVDQIIQNTNEADYLIDVQTTWWGFGYQPTDWSHYRVAYWAKTRLINLHTKKVVAEGGCRSNPTPKGNLPTLEDMLENEAALLKSMINAAASMCQKEMENEVFKL